jgi:alanyl-tRNA synthetase
MCEERHLTIDMVEFESSRKEAQEKSRKQTTDRAVGSDLDVHAIAELDKSKVPKTDDSFKYAYTSKATDADAEYGLCIFFKLWFLT